MAKFKRYEKRGSNKQSKSERRVASHMENKYYKRQKNEEFEKILVDDIDDYLEDHYF